MLLPVFSTETCDADLGTARVDSFPSTSAPSQCGHMVSDGGEGCDRQPVKSTSGPDSTFTDAQINTTRLTWCNHTALQDHVTKLV